MDLRDNIHEQLAQHIGTLRVLAAQATPPLTIWEEMQRILSESATSLELFVLPKVEAKTPYLDLRTGQLGGSAKIAEFVGATSGEGIETLPERPDVRTGGFLRAKGPNSEALINGNGAPAEVTP